MSEGLALHWRLLQPRYNLIGTMCGNCGDHFFPPRNICPECRRKSKIERFRFSGRGEVYTYTVVRAAPTGFEFQAPYIIAVVALKEGAMCTAQIVDCLPEDISIGMPLEMTFRKVIADDDAGIIRYGYKFRPLDALAQKASDAAVENAASSTKKAVSNKKSGKSSPKKKGDKPKKGG